jgi:predicted transcriptional regulator with HTH domain
MGCRLSECCRKVKNAKKSENLLQGLKARVSGRFQLASDGFKACCEKRSGVAVVFGDEIDYGIENNGGG